MQDDRAVDMRAEPAARSPDLRRLLESVDEWRRAENRALVVYVGVVGGRASVLAVARKLGSGPPVVVTRRLSYRDFGPPGEAHGHFGGHDGAG